MTFTCRRCDETFDDQPYWVTSNDGGTILLHMKVCRRCSELACSLGLHAEPVAPAPRPAMRQRPAYLQAAPK